MNEKDVSHGGGNKLAEVVEEKRFIEAALSGLRERIGVEPVVRCLQSAERQAMGVIVKSDLPRIIRIGRSALLEKQEDAGLPTGRVGSAIAGGHVESSEATRGVILQDLRGCP